MDCNLIVLVAHTVTDDKRAAPGSSESVYFSQSASGSSSNISREVAVDVKETLRKNQTSGLYSRNLV